VRLLLDTGKVDVNSRDNGGQTPISRAASRGHEAVVKLLLTPVRSMSTLEIMRGRRRYC